MKNRNTAAAGSDAADYPKVQLQHRQHRERVWLALCLPALSLGGCYVIPVGTAPDGSPAYAYTPVPPTRIVGAPSAAASAVPYALPGGPMPAALNVRLYPINELANHTGVLSGQVTNFLSGKGRFQFQYQGDTLVGEATRVSGEERKGIAAAYGSRGTYARCEYQMTSPFQGAGVCNFSNGAQYQVHIGT